VRQPSRPIAGGRDERRKGVQAMRMDLIVVGAGRAGLAAAAAATEAGLSVAVVDERRTPGGRVNGALGASAHDPDGAWLSPPLGNDATAIAEIARLRAAAGEATFVADALVWGLFPGWTLAVARGGRGTERLDGDQVVLATGSYVARSPFPGHELDGVVTPLGLVRALEAGLVRPDEAVVVLDGDDADDVVGLLLREGVEDVVLLGARARSAACDVVVIDGAPEAHGDPRVREVTARLADGGSRTVPAAWVVASGPRTAAGELATLAGCTSRFDGYQAGFRPRCGADGATELGGLFLAGSLAGAVGAEASTASGTIAGVAAAVRAGRAPVARLAALLAERPPAPKRAPAPIPPVYRDLDPAATRPVCFCTGATFAEATASIRDGARSVDDVKRQAKAGMGACQGRGCHRAVVRLLDVVGGVDVATLPPMRVRPPVRPLTARAMYAGEVPA
jgi:thioredoxin reductase